MTFPAGHPANDPHIEYAVRCPGGRVFHPTLDRSVAATMRKWADATAGDLVDGHGCGHLSGHQLVEHDVSAWRSSALAQAVS